MLVAFLIAAALTTDAWLADFHQILDEMSTHYANLDSAIHDRRMDLPDLRRKTEAAIRYAKSDAEARQAIDSFLRAFGDGHVNIDWTPEPHEEAKTSGCASYALRPDNNAIDFRTLSEFTPLDAADAEDFSAGILKLRGGRRAGILRIQQFSASIHPRLCTAAGGDESRIYDLLTTALERRIRAIASAGADALVVDLTGNGGGSDWVQAAARALTRVKLRSPRLGFIRHPHWTKELREELAALDDEPSPAGARSLLQRAIAASEIPCDRSGLWLDQPQVPSCSLVVPDMLYASGVLAYKEPGKKTVLFNPSEYQYHEGVNKLPLYVIVDGRTASASEMFAAMLHDNHAATILGTPTFGAGCGHTNGGIPATLKNSGARLELPDCVRFRADGSNEVTGVVPDVLIPFRGLDSRFQRAAKAEHVLETIVKPLG